MKKYKAQDGNIYDESYLRNKYGDSFDTYVSNGSFVLVDDTKSKSNGQDKSPGKYQAQDGNVYDESYLRNKYGDSFDTYVSNGSFKKKDGGGSQDTIVAKPSGASVQPGSSNVPSNGQLKESDQPQESMAGASGAMGAAATGLTDNLPAAATEPIPKGDYEFLTRRPGGRRASVYHPGTPDWLKPFENADLASPDVYKPQKLSNFLNNPTAEGISEIMSPPKIVNDNESIIKKDVAGAFEKNITDHFYAGTLSETDVGRLVEYSGMVRNKDYASYKKIADEINQRNRGIIEEGMAKGDDLQYAINKKDRIAQINQIDAVLNDIKYERGGAVVPANTTNLPGPVFDGKRTVDKDEYVAEQLKKRQELQNLVEFGGVNFSQKHAIAEQAATRAVTSRLEEYKKINKLPNDWVPDQYLITKFVDEEAGKSPTLIAGKGADAIAPFPIGTAVRDISAGHNSEDSENYFTWTDPTGRSSTFKKSDFPRINATVRDYFNTKLPAKQATLADLFGGDNAKFQSYEDRVKIGNGLLEGKIEPQGKDKAFFPIISGLEKINAALGDAVLKNLVASTDIQLKAEQQSLYAKVMDNLSSNPRFIEISKTINSKIAAGIISEEEGKKEFSQAIRVDPALKPIFDKAEESFMGTVKSANKTKLDYITNSFKNISPSLSMGENGLTVFGASPEDVKKFMEKYGETNSRAIGETTGIEQQESDELAMSHVIKYGGAAVMLENIGRGTVPNIVAGWGRYFDIPGLTVWGEGAESNNLLAKSAFIKKNSEWQDDWSSLINPLYYLHNTANSLVYMAPGIVAGALSGGGGAMSFFLGSMSETWQDAVQINNDLLTTGVNKYGEPITVAEASQASSEEFAVELGPNLLLAWGEVGALFRGAPRALKRTIAGEITGPLITAGITGIEEGAQEGLQGYFQQTTKDIAQGKPEMDFWDYMKTDDFRQNFFGGLTGGFGYAAPRIGKRLLYAPATFNTWNGILSTARENTELQFNENVTRGYALNEELKGTGGQFRDGLLLRVSKQDYKDKDELAQILSTLQYSQKLKAYSAQVKVSGQNVNGLAAVHNMIMSDEYEESAKTLGENTAAGKIAKAKSKEHLEEATRIYHGNTDGVYSITNAATNSPVFISQRDATALQESGDLQRMWNKGYISDVSSNIKVDKGRTQGEGQKLSPEEVIRREAQKGNLPSVYNEIVNSNPGMARQVLIDLAGQKHGVKANGKLDLNGPAPIANKAVDDAVTEVFPDRKSLAVLLYRRRTSDFPTEVETAQYIGEAKNSDKGLFAELFKTAQAEYTFGGLNSEEVVAAAYHKMQNISAGARTPQQSNFIHDVHKLLNNHAETIRSNQGQAGQEGNEVRPGADKGRNDLQRAAEEKTVNGETGEQVNLPDHGVTVGEMLDRAGSYQGKKGKFIRRGDEVIFKADGFGGLTAVLGKYDDVVNRPVDDFGIQAEQSAIAHSDGVFTIRGEKFVNNFKNPLDAVNHSKKGYAVTLENEKGQKRTFRGSMAEDIATQIFYQEIKKEENGKEQFEGFINSNPEVIQSIQDGGHTETPAAGAVDNTGEVLLQAKDQEIRDAEADQTEQTDQKKAEAEQTVEEQRAEAVKNALKPEVELVFAPTDKLMGSTTDRFGMIDDQEKIKEDFEKLNKLIECCYG
jgi:hypothetical protein